MKAGMNEVLSKPLYFCDLKKVIKIYNINITK